MPRAVLPFLAAAVVLLQGAGAADYSYPLVERSVSVRHDDLDLNNLGDARILLGRIERAARQACGFMPERDRAWPQARGFISKDYSRCTWRAVDDAVAKLRSPVVFQALAERRSETTRF